MREMVEETIDLDELDRHQYVIKPAFDEALMAIKARLEAVRDELDDQHRTVADDLGMEMDGKVLHFEHHSQWGHCFRLTRKEGNALKGKKAYIELKSQSAGVYFTTRTLKELNDSYTDLTKEYEKKQGSLVKEVIAIAGQSLPLSRVAKRASCF